MIISEDRLFHLAHLVFDVLYNDDLLDFEDEDRVLRNIRQELTDYFKKDEKIDEIIKNKINSLTKKVYEGSIEYDVLYSKYYEQEIKKFF